LDPTDPSLAGCASRVLALSAACTPMGDCFVCVVDLPLHLSVLAADGGRTMRKSSASSKMRSTHGSASIRWMRMSCESALQRTDSVAACFPRSLCSFVGSGRRSASACVVRLSAFGLGNHSSKLLLCGWSSRTHTAVTDAVGGPEPASAGSMPPPETKTTAQHSGLGLPKMLPDTPTEKNLSGETERNDETDSGIGEV
jgi:hypothetical protein